MRTTAGRQVPDWVVGLIAAVVVAVGVIYAFTQFNPFATSYRVQAVFDTATNVRPDSPVRIAGVNVGTITEVEHVTAGDGGLLGTSGANGDELTSSATGAAIVTMDLDDEALPLRTDAQMKLRPRLFLEGNLFVDVKPGSPGAPEIEEGHVFGTEQTSVAVQFDQVLTMLQADVRDELRTFLNQLGNALIDHGGAEGFREMLRTSPGAFRFTSQVNEAFLGENPGDLGRLIDGLGSMVRALGANEQALLDTITNLRIFTGALAAESPSLEAAIPELQALVERGPAALVQLNAALPSLRAFAREALPGVRSAPGALEAATPMVEQLRLLSRPAELRALMAELRTGVPQLARLSRDTVPFLRQSRALASCFNEVIIPWSNLTTEHPVHEAPGRVFEQTAWGLVGLAGESRSGDANGQYIRVQAGGGFNTVQIPGFDGSPDRVGVLPDLLLGAMPTIESSAKTPFRPDVPCETQDEPDLRPGAPGDPPPQQPISQSSLSGEGAPSVFGELSEGLGGALEGLGETGLATSGDGEMRPRGREQRQALDELREFMQERWPELRDQILSLGGGGG